MVGVVHTQRFGGRLVIYPEPIPDFSTLYAVPDFTTLLFSYLSTTSSHDRHLYSCMYLAVRCISHIVPVPGGELSACWCNSHCQFCFEVTSVKGENVRNFRCNVGATHPIRIFLPAPSRLSTPLWGFDIFNSFCCGPRNGSPPIPSSSTPSVTSLLQCLVCPHWICCVKI